jgi:hypothetical protein
VALLIPVNCPRWEQATYKKHVDTRLGTISSHTCILKMKSCALYCHQVIHPLGINSQACAKSLFCFFFFEWSYKKSEKTFKNIFQDEIALQAPCNVVFFKSLLRNLYQDTWINLFLVWTPRKVKTCTCFWAESTSSMTRKKIKSFPQIDGFKIKFYAT